VSLSPDGAHEPPRPAGPVASTCSERQRTNGCGGRSERTPKERRGRGEKDGRAPEKKTIATWTAGPGTVGRDGEGGK